MQRLRRGEGSNHPLRILFQQNARLCYREESSNQRKGARRLDERNVPLDAELDVLAIDRFERFVGLPGANGGRCAGWQRWARACGRSSGQPPGSQGSQTRSRCINGPKLSSNGISNPCRIPRRESPKHSEAETEITLIRAPIQNYGQHRTAALPC